MSKKKSADEIMQELAEKTKVSLRACEMKRGCTACMYVKEPFCKTLLIKDSRAVINDMEHKAIRMSECIAHLVKESASDLCSVCVNFKPAEKSGEFTECKYFNKQDYKGCLDGVITYFMKKE